MQNIRRVIHGVIGICCFCLLSFSSRANSQKTEKAKDVYFPCQTCGAKFTSENRYKWLPTVKWVKYNPDSQIAGFHINAFYSPWVTWDSLIKKWLDARTIKPIYNRLMPLNVASPKNVDMIWLADRTTIRK